MLTGNKRTADRAASSNTSTSKSMKQREKKKMVKLTEKKNKHAKLSGILDTLQKQAEEQKAVEKVSASLLSSKNLGVLKRDKKK